MRRSVHHAPSVYEVVSNDIKKEYSQCIMSTCEESVLGSDQTCAACEHRAFKHKKNETGITVSEVKADHLVLFYVCDRWCHNTVTHAESLRHHCRPTQDGAPLKDVGGLPLHQNVSLYRLLKVNSSIK